MANEKHCSSSANMVNRLTRSRSCLSVDRSKASEFMKIELRVSNLRPDLNGKDLASRLENYFTSAGVTVPHFRISVIASRGKKKSKKHAFVRLISEEEREKLIKLDGAKNLSFVLRGKSLKVRNSEDMPSLKDNFCMGSDLYCQLQRQDQSSSTPALSCYQRSKLKDMRTSSFGRYGREFFWGQVLHTEDRTTEYKRGSGGYIRSWLLHHVRKYVCAFLNSEGGRLVIGVDDRGRVHGVKCNREEEDDARCQIDAVIKGFYPHVFTDRYVLDFISVRTSPNDLTELDEVDPLLKVIEISVSPTSIEYPTLYENDKGQIFIRRDGGVEGPLKSTQIIDWCREKFAQENFAQGASRGQDSEKTTSILDCINGECTSATLHNKLLRDELHHNIKKTNDCLAELGKTLEKHLLCMQHELAKREMDLRHELVEIVERSCRRLRSPSVPCSLL